MLTYFHVNLNRLCGINIYLTIIKIFLKTHHLLVFSFQKLKQWFHERSVDDIDT